MCIFSHKKQTSSCRSFLLSSRPISDIDLPEELPDFLKPKPSTARPIRPIQDIDLPDGTGVIQPDESAIDESSKEEEEGIFQKQLQFV